MPTSLKEIPRMIVITKPKNNIQRRWNLSSFWQFTRPHAFLGTFLQFLIIVSFASLVNPSLEGANALNCLLTILLIHIYGMGVNQIADVNIDKINKPQLPLASGEISIRVGIFSSALCALTGLALAATQGWLFLITNALLFCGLSLYSIPPFQWKRHPAIASLTIAISRSFLYVGGYYLVLAEHTSLAEIPISVVIFVFFMFFYALGISFAKDAPDIGGDLQYQIRTFASRIGPKSVLLIALLLQFSTVAAMSVLSYLGYLGKPNGLFALAHGAGLVLLLANFRCLDTDNQESMASHYMNLWKILYFELFIFFLVTISASYF